jgi:antitoxin ParD1/3/4
LEDNRTMTELSKFLPPDLKNWIAQRVADGAFFDADDYLRALVRKDRAEAEDTAWVRAMIEEGEASGYLDREPGAIIEDIITERRARRG